MQSLNEINEHLREDNNESDEDVTEKLRIVKQYIMDSKHIINFPQDDEILTRFLLIENMNTERAIARIENFCFIRCSDVKGLSRHFQRIINDDVKFYLKSGFFVPLSVPDDCEIVVYVTMRNWDISLKFDSILRNLCNDLELLADDPRSQTRGTSLIIDMGHLSRKQSEMLFSKSGIKDLIRIWQEGFPVKNNKIIFYKKSTVIDIIINLCKLWFKQLATCRIYHVKENNEQLHNFWPNAKEFLPLELGGTADLEATRQSWEHKIWNHLSKDSPFANLKTNEQERQKESEELIRKYKEIPDEFPDAGELKITDAN